MTALDRMMDALYQVFTTTILVPDQDTTLSNVLNGREAPSVELAARIRAFLDSPEGD